MKKFWGKHKATILIALFSGLLGHIITQAVSVHNLSRLLRSQENRELLSSTRLAIGFLKQVEGELDDNLAFMLSHDYLMSLEFESPYDQSALFGSMAAASATNAAEAKAAQAFGDYAKHVAGVTARLSKMESPAEPLSTAVWDHGAPEIADIDYNLLRELSDYYLLARRVNNTIKAFSDVHPGASYNVEYAAQLKKTVSFHNENVAKLKQKQVVELKNKIERETQRLSDIRRKIEGT